MYLINYKSLEDDKELNGLLPIIKTCLKMKHIYWTKGPQYSCHI